MRNSVANPKPRIWPTTVGAPPLRRGAAGLLHRRIAFGIGIRLRAHGRFRPADDGRPDLAALRRRRAAADLPARLLPAGAVGRHGILRSSAGGAVGGGIVGGGIVGGAAARAAGGGNNGGGAAAAQGNSPFVPDEIVTSFAPGTTPQAIAQFAQRTNLAQLESQSFPLIGTSLYRWRIGGGRSVPSVVQALGTENIVATVQPNYLFALQEDNAKETTPKPLPPARAMPLNMFWPSCKSRRRIRSRPENPSRSR